MELTTNKVNFFINSGHIFFGADTYFRTSFYSSPSPSAFLNADGYAIVNARFGFRVLEGFSAFIWGRNLLDQNYFEQLLPAGGNAGQYAAVLGDPQTFAFTLTYKLRAN